MAIYSRPNVPYIPEDVTVHLGEPNEPAENVTVIFPDYIKNVASNEIYPTWPESAIRANIYAQITFTLYRIFTSWYRNQGYDFDITNSSQFDQTFVPNKNYFSNISIAVDDIFTSYAIRQGELEPAYTPYCNGTTEKCDGLSKWGSVSLAKKGYNPYDILRYYYGDSLDIAKNVPVDANFEPYPLYPLQLGVFGLDVKAIQHDLNKISRNYPSIPKIFLPDGVFREDTKDSVIAFQNIFNLIQDGIVGNSTWYKIKYINKSVNSIKTEISNRFAKNLQEDDFDAFDVFAKLIQQYCNKTIYSRIEEF